MRASFFSVCLCLLALLGAPAAGRAANTRPVSIQDLCLMLRSGYTGSEVLQETAARPLLESVTPDAEQTLRAAGADQHLVDALKAKNALSPTDAATARQQQVVLEQRAAAELARARQTAGAVPTARNAGAAPPSAAGDPHAIENLLHGRLVTFRDEKTQAASNDVLEGKTLIGLYFTSLMSKAGQPFSSGLVQFYRNVAPKHPEFEIVLVSSDASPYAMENLMRHAQMPWPALAFDQVGQVPMLSHFADRSGASRLLVVDNFGRIHASYHISVDNPQLPMVLPDLEKVIADPSKNSVLAPPGPAGR